MATAVLMPNVGITVESCVLTEWHKKPGAAVRVGELLFTYETDKSTLEETAPCDGVLLACFFDEGDDVPIMTAVCAVGEAGEDFSALAPQKAAAPVPAAPAASAAAVAPVVSAAAVPAALAPGAALASPRAKALAQKGGVDLRLLAPSGAEGRIIERDVRAAMQSGGLRGARSMQEAESDGLPPAVTDDATDERMPMIRRTIARQMLQSLQNSAQLTHTLHFDASDMLALRKAIKNGKTDPAIGNLSLNDMILFLVAHTLKDPAHRALNAHLLAGDVLRTFGGVHLGVAVDTERGLYVPTIFHADRLSAAELAVQCRSLAAQCRSGEIAPEQLLGGSFTVSNLGSFGIESFTPILNPPQTGILGVNTLTTQVRMKGGQPEFYPAMALSLTYDHRAVDGAPASRFLAQLKENAERFTAFLQEN